MSLTSVFADNGLAAVTQQPTCPINPVSYAVTDVLHHSEGTQATSSISFVASTISDAFEQTLPAPVTTAIKGSWQALSKWGRAIYNTLPSISIPVASAEAENSNNTDFTELFRTTTDEECAESKNVPETARKLQDTPFIEVPITIKGTEQRINRIQLPLTAGDNPQTLNVDASGLPEGGEFDAASVVRETFTPFEAGERLETVLEVQNDGGWIVSAAQLGATEDYVYHLHSNFTLNRRAEFPTLLDDRIKLWATLNENTLIIVNTRSDNLNIYYWNSNNTFSIVSSFNWADSALDFRTLFPKGNGQFEVIYTAQSGHPSLIRNTPFVNTYQYHFDNQTAKQTGSKIIVEEIPLDSSGNPTAYGHFEQDKDGYWISGNIGSGTEELNFISQFELTLSGSYNQTDQLLIPDGVGFFSVNEDTAFVRYGPSSDRSFARYDIPSKQETHILSADLENIAFNDQQQEIFVHLDSDYLSLDSGTLAQKADLGALPRFQFFNNNQLINFKIDGDILRYDLDPNYALGETGSLVIKPQLAYQVAAELNSERTVSVAYTTESGSGDVEFRLQYQLGSASVDPACTQEFSGNVDDGFSFILNGRCIQDSDFRAWDVNIPLPAGVQLTPAEPSLVVTEISINTLRPFISDGENIYNTLQIVGLGVDSNIIAVPNVDAWVTGYHSNNVLTGEQFLPSSEGGFDIFLKVFNFTGNPDAPYEQIYSVGPYDSHPSGGFSVVPATFDDTLHCFLGVRESNLVDPNTWSCFNMTDHANITHLGTVKGSPFNPSMTNILRIQTYDGPHIANNLGSLVPINSTNSYLQAFASDATFTSSTLTAEHITTFNNEKVTLASKTDGLHIYSNLGVSASSPEPQEIAFFATDSDCIISGVNEAGDILAIAEKNGIVHIMNIRQAADDFVVLHLLHEVAIGFTLGESRDTAIIFRHDHNDEIVVYRSTSPENMARIIPPNGDWLNIGEVSVTVDQLGTNSKNLILKDDAGREIELPITISGQPIAPTLTDFAHTLLDENGQITIEAPEWTGLTFNSGQNIPDTYVKLTDYLTLQNGGVETYFVSSPSAIRPFDAREPSIVDIVDTDGSSDTFLKIPSFVPSSASFNTDTSGSAIEGISQTFSFQLGSSFSPNALTLNIPITIQARSVEPLLSFSLTTETGTQTLTGLPTLNNPGSISDEDGLLFTYLQVDGPASNLTQTGAATETARYFGSRVLGTQLETLPPQNTIGTHSIYALIRRFHPVTKTSLDPQVPWFIANITNRGLGFSNPGRLLDSSVSLFVGVPLDITFNGPETVCSLSADGSYSAQFILSAPASATGYTVTQYSGEARARISASSPNTVIINGRCLLPEPYPDAGQIDRRVDVETTLNPLSSLDATLPTAFVTEGIASNYSITVSTPGDSLDIDLFIDGSANGFDIKAPESLLSYVETSFDTLGQHNRFGLRKVPTTLLEKVGEDVNRIPQYQIPLNLLFRDSTTEHYGISLTAQDFQASEPLNDALTVTNTQSVIQVIQKPRPDNPIIEAIPNEITIGDSAAILLHRRGIDPESPERDVPFTIGFDAPTFITQSADPIEFNKFFLNALTPGGPYRYTQCAQWEPGLPSIVPFEEAMSRHLTAWNCTIPRMPDGSEAAPEQIIIRPEQPSGKETTADKVIAGITSAAGIGFVLAVFMIPFACCKRVRDSRARQIAQKLSKDDSILKYLSILAQQVEDRDETSTVSSLSGSVGSGSVGSDLMLGFAQLHPTNLYSYRLLESNDPISTELSNIGQVMNDIANMHNTPFKNGAAIATAIQVARYLAKKFQQPHNDIASDDINLWHILSAMIENHNLTKGKGNSAAVQRLIIAMMLNAIILCTRLKKGEKIEDLRTSLPEDTPSKLLQTVVGIKGQLKGDAVKGNPWTMALLGINRTQITSFPIAEGYMHFAFVRLKGIASALLRMSTEIKFLPNVDRTIDTVRAGFGALLVLDAPEESFNIAGELLESTDIHFKLAAIIIYNMLLGTPTVESELKSRVVLKLELLSHRPTRKCYQTAKNYEKQTRPNSLAVQLLNRLALSDITRHLSDQAQQILARRGLTHTRLQAQERPGSCSPSDLELRVPAINSSPTRQRRGSDSASVGSHASESSNDSFLSSPGSRVKPFSMKAERNRQTTSQLLAQQRMALMQRQRQIQDAMDNRPGRAKYMMGSGRIVSAGWETPIKSDDIRDPSRSEPRPSLAARPSTGQAESKHTPSRGPLTYGFSNVLFRHPALQKRPHSAGPQGSLGSSAARYGKNDRVELPPISRASRRTPTMPETPTTAVEHAFTSVMSAPEPSPADSRPQMSLPASLEGDDLSVGRD